MLLAGRDPTGLFATYRRTREGVPAPVRAGGGRGVTQFFARDGATPPAAYEAWIETYAYEDILPVPILPTLNATGYAIPKRMFDAYCVKRDGPEMGVEEHARQRARQVREDNRERSERKQREKSLGKPQQAQTGRHTTGQQRLRRSNRPPRAVSAPMPRCRFGVAPYIWPQARSRRMTPPSHQS